MVSLCYIPHPGLLKFTNESPSVTWLNRLFEQPTINFAKKGLLIWTGWKASQESTSLEAQWIYVAPSGRKFYASAPGGQGEFKDGDVFEVGSGFTIDSALGGERYETFQRAALHKSDAFVRLLTVVPVEEWL